ncbi:MAG: indolepyruvate oxidoreductase subunit beta [Anaerolineaceae bacterium]|jgi:indolepyruvate ferredoxin oxidoreductase beta subunit
MSTKNILLTGVGGQGTILASKLLTVGLIDAGYDVKMSEVHGMSQREGPVLTHVRFGKKVFSPIVEKRKADVIMGFEELEVLRNLDYLRDDGQGIVIFNRVRVNPMGVQTGQDKYPTNGEELIRARAGKVIALDGQAMARELGNPRVMNIILLGALIKQLGLEEIDWLRVIAENVNAKYVPLNQEALKLGLGLE